jgi:hypothetical protein
VGQGGELKVVDATPGAARAYRSALYRPFIDSASALS